MKRKQTLLGSLFNLKAGFLKALAITLCLAGSDRAMAQRTWNGGAAPDPNWSNAANWTSGDMSNFVGPLNFSGNIQNTTNHNGGYTFGAINFVNDGTVGKTNAFVLNGNDITLGANITTTASSSAITDTINNNLVVASDKVFALNTNHHLMVNGNISGGGLTKSQAEGSLTLAGDNTYNGITNIRQGTIFVSLIADLASGNDSNFGFGNLQIGIAGVGGILNYTGGGSTTARTLQIGAPNTTNTVFNGTGGATISATGSNGGSGLKFTAANFTTEDLVSTASARALTLSGSNTDANSIDGVIANVRTTGGTTATNLQKSDAGRWILGGANTYTGSVSVTGGVLQLDHANAVTGGLLNTSTVNAMTLNGGILGLGAGDLTRSPGSGPGQILITSNNSGFAAYGADRSVNLGGLSAGVSWGTGGFFSAGTTTMVLSHATATHTLYFQNPINLNGADRTFFVNNGAAAVDAALSAIISGSGNGFVKSGPGTLLISGINTYTGPTGVNGGTLRLGANDTLPDTGDISLNAGTLDVSSYADDAGTLDVIGTTSINIGFGGSMAFADSSAIDWNGGSLNITGSVVSGSSIRFGTTATGLTSTQRGLISVNGSSGNYKLDANGFLVTSVDDTFLTWSDGASFDVDNNKDGIENGLAWLLGAPDPNVNANSFLPVVTGSGGNLKMTFDMLPESARDGAQLIVEHSSDLGISDPWTGVLVPESTGGTAPFSFAVSGTNPLEIEVTISSTEAVSGKLFARLRAVKAAPPSTRFFQQGINQMVVYPNVPGVIPSNQYRIRVRSAATNQEWKSPFAMMTTASSTNGAGFPLIYGWTHTYANIEMNSPVEVEISKFNGQPITSGVTRPLNKTGPVTFLNGKAYFTMNNPAQVTLDVNGQMDNNNTGKGYTGPDIHAVSIFANPLLQDRPNPNGSNVFAVIPGTLPPTDGPWTTLYFLPGEHDIGVQYRVKSNRDYYIPGDAIVHGSISNTGMVYNEARNIRIFGYGTLSGERFVRTSTQGADGIFTPIGVGSGARNVHVNGITIADPAYYSVMLGNPDPFPSQPNTVKWAKIIGWRANGDGINPFSNTLIEDTFIRTQDDSTYVNGLGMKRLVLWNDANGSSFVLTAMPQRALIVEDCDIIYSRAAFDKWNGGRVFSLRGEDTAGGAAGTGVVFRNIRIEDPRPTLQQFFICTELPPLFGSETNRPVRGPGDISNVLFENVSIAAPPVITSEPQILWGYQNAQIRNFVFDNLTMGGVKVTSPSFFMTNGFVVNLTFQ